MRSILWVRLFDIADEAQSENDVPKLVVPVTCGTAGLTLCVAVFVTIVGLTG